MQLNTFKTICGAIFVLALMHTGIALADDFNAEQFVQDNCTRCHSDSVYSRPDHKMKSMQQLHAQVRRCDANVGTKLFDDELNTVVEYLNEQYYRFEK